MNKNNTQILKCSDKLTVSDIRFEHPEGGVFCKSWSAAHVRGTCTYTAAAALNPSAFWIVYDVRILRLLVNNVRTDGDSDIAW